MLLAYILRMGMQKSLGSAVARACENSWKKFASPSAARGGTVWPKDPGDQERAGVRWDYDGEVQQPDGPYHKFQMQPNAGKIPSSIARWRNANGGTHAVLATAYVKKDGTKEDVTEGLTEANKSVNS